MKRKPPLETQPVMVGAIQCQLGKAEIRFSEAFKQGMRWCIPISVSNYVEWESSFILLVQAAKRANPNVKLVFDSKHQRLVVQGPSSSRYDLSHVSHAAGRVLAEIKSSFKPQSASSACNGVMSELSDPTSDFNRQRRMRRESLIKRRPMGKQIA